MDGITIGELAARSGLNVSAIRFYQRRGLLPPRDVRYGWQRYGPDAVTRLALIELAKRAGFTLDEISAVLDAMDGESPATTWRAMFHAKVNEIDAQVQRLHAMRDLLTEAIDCSCLTLDRAALVPTALGWAVESATATRTQAAIKAPALSDRPRVTSRSQST